MDEIGELIAEIKSLYWQIIAEMPTDDREWTAAESSPLCYREGLVVKW